MEFWKTARVSEADRNATCLMNGLGFWGFPFLNVYLKKITLENSKWQDLKTAKCTNWNCSNLWIRKRSDFAVFNKWQNMRCPSKDRHTSGCFFPDPTRADPHGSLDSTKIVPMFNDPCTLPTVDSCGGHELSKKSTRLCDHLSTLLFSSQILSDNIKKFCYLTI